MTEEIQIGKLYKYGKRFVIVEDIKIDRASYGASSVIYRYLGEQYNNQRDLDIGYARLNWKEIRDNNKIK